MPAGSRRFAALLCLLLAQLSGCAANKPVDDTVLDAERWRHAVTAGDVTRVEPLRLVVARLVAQPEAALLISHAAGPEGVEWAGQVRRWLVALGIASARILLRPDSPDNNIHLAVKMEVKE